MPPTNLILASASLYRKNILKQILKFPFKVIPANIDESQVYSTSPVKQAMELARRKARTIANKLPSTKKSIILAADTLVNHKNKIIGKAKNRSQAKQIIQELNGTWHNLITGYCVIKKNHLEIEKLGKLITKVHFRKINDLELEKYLDNKSWKNKAGAYGIQEEAQDFISKIEGCFLNVVGLPLCHIANFLLSFGLKIDLNKVKEKCEQYNKINCKIKFV